MGLICNTLIAMRFNFLCHPTLRDVIVISDLSTMTKLGGDDKGRGKGGKRKIRSNAHMFKSDSLAELSETRERGEI